MIKSRGLSPVPRKKGCVILVFVKGGCGGGSSPALVIKDGEKKISKVWLQYHDKTRTKVNLVCCISLRLHQYIYDVHKETIYTKDSNESKLSL